MSRITFFSYLLILFCFPSSRQTEYEVDVKGEAQHGYYVTVSIGTPPQSIKLLVDTGSSNLAVAGTPPLKESKTYFRYKDSHTFQKLDTVVDLHYVEGHWSGFLGSDLVSLKGRSNDSVKCLMACMTDIDNVFDINSKFDGLLGLAYPAVAYPNSSVLPFFDTIQEAQNMSNVFALSLCGPFFSNKESETSCGKVHLGYISAEHYKDDIVYSPIIKERFYEIILTNLKVGSKQIQSNCQTLNKPRAMIDSGTTRLLLPILLYDQTLKELKKKIKAIPEYSWLNETVACFPDRSHDFTSFPVIVLSLYHTENSSFDLVITPELYLLHFKDKSHNLTCFIVGIGISEFGTVIGSTILKGYYVVFDREDKKVGFGNSTTRQCSTDSCSYVTRPWYLSNRDFSDCMYEEGTYTSRVGAGIIVLLIMVLILAFVLLYLMIRSYILKRSDYHSDTNSLVGDD